MIGDQIKKYRKKKGLTQEELGRLVNVTTQSVSKWERGGAPDAEIIPQIAEALGVTTDMLFGRTNTHSVEDMVMEEILRLGREEGFQEAFRLLWSVSLGLSGIASIKESFGMDVLENLRNPEGFSYYSRVCVDEGMIDAKLDTDARYFFIMPEPAEGYARLFEDADQLAETFAVFAEKDVLKIIFYMYSRKNTPLSLSLISAKTGIPEGRAAQLMDRLCKCRMAVSEEIETEQGHIRSYVFLNETIVLPLLCFAKELRDEKIINWGVWFERNKPLF